MAKGSSRREFLARGAAAVAAVGFAPAGVTNAWAADSVHAELDVSPWSTASNMGHPAVGAVPHALPLGNVTAGGPLGRRMGQNFGRLQSDIYKPAALWRQTNWKSWPGDFEGRALLADTLLARATGKIPAYYDAMAGAYAGQLNTQGYFGPALDVHAINEQQLSGHGWFLRALCELYEYQRADAGAVQSQTAEQTLTMIRAVVRNLALPLRGKYELYPIDPAVRTAAAAPTAPGAVDGHLSGQHGDWAVSSDTGCAFIFLDGLAHAWVVLKSAGAPEAAPLKALIDEVMARFTAMDLVAVKAQTHASLTAMRALLRVHAETGDAKLLSTVRDRYALYRTTAMTATYANTNWFGRPETWTEPCAIIDSFMVATQLWQRTGDPAYLEDAHHIWFNGVGRGQRGNGGFGTDTCAGFGSPWVRVRSYEAYFCCTMRGSEGFARAAQYLYFTRPGELTVPFFSDSEATVDVGSPQRPEKIKLRQTAAYPYAGAVRIEVLANPAHTPVALRMFAPSWTTNQRLTLNGREIRSWKAAGGFAGKDGFATVRIAPKAGDVLEYDSMIEVCPRDPVNAAAMPGYYAFHAGPLVLGYRPPADAAATLRSPAPSEVHIPRNTGYGLTKKPLMYEIAGVDGTLSPIDDLNESDARTTDPCPRQVLFRG